METATAAAHPAIGEMEQALLEAGALGVRMSGSGPTVFGIFDTENGCRDSAKKHQKKGWRLYPAETLAGPLYGEHLAPASTPALAKGDLVVVFSGSAETKTVADIAESAKEIGGRLCLITSKRESRIGRIADCCVVIESQRDTIGDETAEFEIRQMMGKHKSFAPLGTLFETASVIFADAVISRLMEIKEINVETLKGRHVNIE